MSLAPKPSSESCAQLVQPVLPNDANPYGNILGGTVMHLMDVTAATAAIRHARSAVVTASVDGLEFLHPIKVGDFIILHATVTCVFTTSLEVEVTVHSEGTLTGEQQLTSHAFFTFVTFDKTGGRVPVPPLLLQSDDDRRRADEAHARRAERLKRRAATAVSM